MDEDFFRERIILKDLRKEELKNQNFNRNDLTKEILEDLVMEFSNKEIGEIYNTCEGYVLRQCSKWDISRSNSIKTILRKEGLFRKYGVVSASQVGDFKKKFNDTIKKKQEENPSYMNDIVEKRRNTNIERRGVDSPRKDPNVIKKAAKNRENKRKIVPDFEEQIVQKRIQTSNERYGVSNFKQKDFSDKAKAILFSKENFSNYIETCGFDKVVDLCADLGISISTYEIYLKKYNLTGISHSSGTSIEERNLYNFIKNKYSVAANVKKAAEDFEADILSTENLFAIEYNGFYWHSLEKRESGYHLRKTMAFAKKGIPLIHIYPDEWPLLKKNIDGLISYYVNSLSIEDFLDIECQETLLSKEKIKVGLFCNQNLMIEGIFEKFCGKEWRVIFPFEGCLNPIKHSFEYIITYFIKRHHHDDIFNILCFIERDKFPLEKIKIEGYYVSAFDTDFNIWHIVENKRSPLKLDYREAILEIEDKDLICGTGYNIFRITFPTILSNFLQS